MTKAYHLNAPGDFYVLDGCCTMCGYPSAVAPSLFGGFTEDGAADAEQCWVKAQPRNDAELEAMLEAFAGQELDCIRYRGEDPKIIHRLEALGEGLQVDRRKPWWRFW